MDTKDQVLGIASLVLIYGSLISLIVVLFVYMGWIGVLVIVIAIIVGIALRAGINK
jgi:hypothetical protein